MALTTRCPHCGTAFKVVPDQLKVRDGLVRCGVCTRVFDGRATLVSEIPTLHVEPPGSYSRPSYSPAPVGAAWERTAVAQPPWQMPAAPIPAPAPAPVLGRRSEPSLASGGTPPWDAATGTHASAMPASSGALSSQGAPEVLRGRHHALRRADPVLRDDDVSDMGAVDNDRSQTDTWGEDVSDNYVAADTIPAGEQATAEDLYAVRGEARMRYVDDQHTGRAPPEFMDEGHIQQRAHWGRLWGWACLVAALALLGLSAYVYRVQWATQVPALRPVLELMCVPLQCTVGYERRIERISILSSSLRPPPGGASVHDAQDLVLTAVLRNRFNAPQHWPALTLELKDFSDTVMVRKVLLPRDYLPADALAQPFGPNAERKIVLPLRVRDVQVNGYQLDRFFP